MPLDLVVHSDYLCPWCWNAARRLRRIEDEMAGAVRIAWHGFLLRPHPDPTRTLEQFRRYTESWRRPAADPDAGPFRVWSTDEGPPSHSVPPHLVAKAAAQLGPEAFRAVHDRLFHAYFAENRDITRHEALAAVWADAGLPAEELGRIAHPAVLEAVVGEHNAAVGLGITGVPALRVAGTDLFVVGAQPLETYRRWIARVQESSPG